MFAGIFAPILFLAGASAVLAATAHLGAPARKSGWWELTSTSGGRTGKENLCISDASEAKYSLFDQITQEDVFGAPCTKRDFRRTAEGWDFDLACDTGIPARQGGGIFTNKGTIAGDFQTAFEVRSTITQAGRTARGVIRGEYRGACPRGFVAGDLVIDGRKVLNLLEY